MFGHERGAYTGALTMRKGYFELAGGGTLFLDEIGELPPAAQSQLLRVLDGGEYCRVGGMKPVRANARIIAATNRDLPELVREGKFRKDLYYRLAAFPINMPPLRERPRDLLALARYFLETGMEKFEVYVAPRIPAAEEEKLKKHDWPGNVRELKLMIERCLIELRAAKKSARPIFRIAERLEADPAALLGDWPTLAELKIRYIKMALQKTGGRLSGKSGAAALLGIHPSSLSRFLANSEPGKAN